MSLASITDALEALRAGKPVIVADDENRENEGDVVLSAELATPSGSPGPCAGPAASSAHRCPPSGRTGSTSRPWSK